MLTAIRGPYHVDGRFGTFPKQLIKKWFRYSGSKDRSKKWAWVVVWRSAMDSNVVVKTWRSFGLLFGKFAGIYVENLLILLPYMYFKGIANLCWCLPAIWNLCSTIWLVAIEGENFQIVRGIKSLICAVFAIPVKWKEWAAVRWCTKLKTFVLQ